MTCKHIHEKLSAHAAGELSPEERRTVEAHLRTCLQCRREAHAAARAEEALSLLAAIEPAPDLTLDLHARIATTRRRWGRWAVAAAALAAVVLAAVLASSPLPQPIAPKHIVATTPESHPPAAQAAEPVSTQPATPAPPAARTARAPETVPASEVGRTPAVTIRSVRPVQLAAATHRLPPEPTPAETLPVTAPETAELRPVEEAVEPPTTGVLLVLGPARALSPSPDVHLEITFPNGSRSVYDQRAPRDTGGEARAVQVSYEKVAPRTGMPRQGG